MEIAVKIGSRSKRTDAELETDETRETETLQQAERGRSRRVTFGRLLLYTTVFTLILGGSAAFWEARTSYLQQRYLSGIAAEINYEVSAGQSDALRFPEAGTYAGRLGYTQLPDLIERLTAGPFGIERQSRMSPRMLALIDQGIFTIYHEKPRAGLRILDRDGATLSDSPFPERFFAEFQSIPALVRNTLLFVEDRDLLDPTRPNRNPAVNWGRLVSASMDMGMRFLGSDRSVPGASTLATQLEKFRHSPAGITGGVSDKLRQMASASLRAYLDGPETLRAQERILLDYLNTVPLAAIGGYGEVNGLADGLWAWFGADFDSVSALLSGESAETEVPLDHPELALAYRQVLSLLLAHRRPSYYLASDAGHDALHLLTDRYLTLLHDAGVIPAELRDAARGAQADIRLYARADTPQSFVARKASNAVRSTLLGRMGLSSLYNLDRMDLTAHSTFVRDTQDSVSALITRLHDINFLQQQGLVSFRLLDTGDPKLVSYSVVLYESGREGDLVRVQTDNFEGPFNITGGAKLDLGSTAKLRTLVNYLDIINALHSELSALDAAELSSREAGSGDNITAWSVQYLLANPGSSVAEMLEAAMDRSYSASPAERFFTGGGVHTFVNFDATYNNRTITLREAFRHSVNLPFIRLMRDITLYYTHRLPGAPAGILGTREDLRRREYLERFADDEGRVFLTQFYRKYEGQAPEKALETLMEGRSLSPTRLAWAYRSINPQADSSEFSTWITSHLAEGGISQAGVRDLYRRTNPATMSLNDRGYLAGIHPLELWLLEYLSRHPKATLATVVDASGEVRQEVYRWLFSTSRTAAQDQRIRSILEAEAFREIHKEWSRLGYPFASLVPSYATALGSSADRPDALGELVGIIVNGGVRRPQVRVTQLDFAAGTPYETELRRVADAGERVLSEEVSQVVRRAMLDVVQEGSARRAFGSIRDSLGGAIPIGAKTGTGDHRYRVYGPGGRLIEDRVVNRTSTLVFFIGDRFYGTITAYVSGDRAGDFGFTSSLPAQILRMLGPTLAPLVGSPSETKPTVH